MRQRKIPPLRFRCQFTRFMTHPGRIMRQVSPVSATQAEVFTVCHSSQPTWNSIPAQNPGPAYVYENTKSHSNALRNWASLPSQFRFTRRFTAKQHLKTVTFVLQLTQLHYRPDVPARWTFSQLKRRPTHHLPRFIHYQARTLEENFS